MQNAIVVTGASKGIGAAASRLLAQNGWTVIGVARRRPERFEGEFVEADLSSSDETDEVARMLASRGDVRGVVNNVGAARHETIGAVAPGDFAAIVDLNVRPALQLTQAVIPQMRAAKFGRIVNISSLVVRGLPFRASYAAAKAAIESLTRTMAIELAPDGVTANAVAPGPTETELFRANNPPGGEGEARYLAQTPMRRLGKPEEIGALIAFLCSPGAGFVTGQIIGADGGASLGRA